MYGEVGDSLIAASKKKLGLLNNNPLGYFVAAMLAGVYVGVAIILIFTIGGMLHDQPYVKLIMGMTFGAALSLVLLNGADLYTGNNLIMFTANLRKEATFADTIKLWTVCLIGNWAGALLVACMYVMTGLGNNEATAEFIAKSAYAKMTIPPSELIFRAILCNMVVCFAVWASYKLKEETAKLIMIWWCLFIFITSGYEHSIANMTLLTISLFNPSHYDVSIGLYFYNIILAIIGNTIGGTLFVALPYHLISKQKSGN